MIQNLSPSHASVALLADEPEVPQSVMCPMCHTPASLTQFALDAGGAWQCVRCGQQWNAARLATVAAYAAWVLDRALTDNRMIDRGPTTERLGGTS